MAKKPTKSKTVAAKAPPPKTVDVFYIKSPSYRSFHCDGAWGGVTTRDQISFTIYNERNSIPQETYYELNPDGTAKREVPKKIKANKDGIVRTLEATVFMDYRTAREFHSWLLARIKYYEDQFQVPDDVRLTGPDKKKDKK